MVVTVTVGMRGDARDSEGFHGKATGGIFVGVFPATDFGFFISVLDSRSRLFLVAFSVQEKQKQNKNEKEDEKQTRGQLLSTGICVKR